MSVERITLDTNILVYSIDIDAEFKHERAIEIFWQVRQAKRVLEGVRFYNPFLEERFNLDLI